MMGRRSQGSPLPGVATPRGRHSQGSPLPGVPTYDAVLLVYANIRGMLFGLTKYTRCCSAEIYTGGAVLLEYIIMGDAVLLEYKGDAGSGDLWEWRPQTTVGYLVHGISTSEINESGTHKVDLGAVQCPLSRLF